jgi:hypothetical protein
MLLNDNKARTLDGCISVLPIHHMAIASDVASPTGGSSHHTCHTSLRGQKEPPHAGAASIPIQNMEVDEDSSVVSSIQ